MHEQTPAASCWMHGAADGFAGQAGPVHTVAISDLVMIKVMIN